LCAAAICLEKLDKPSHDRKYSVSFQQIAMAAGALSVVLALIWLAHRAVRSGALGLAPSGRLRVVQSVALDARRRVVLLQCDGMEVLLLTGGTADLLLSAPITPRQVAAGAPA
jgi:flagellar biogenesis protein FliO